MCLGWRVSPRTGSVSRDLGGGCESGDVVVGRVTGEQQLPWPQGGRALSRQRHRAQNGHVVGGQEGRAKGCPSTGTHLTTQVPRGAVCLDDGAQGSRGSGRVGRSRVGLGHVAFDMQGWS